MSPLPPSTIAAWETTRPWEATREDVESGRVAGVVVEEAAGTEQATFRVDGRISVKPSYFDLPPESRRAVLYHEAGHALESRFSMADYQRLLEDPDFNPLDIYDWPGADRLGHNYDEVLAEGYAVLWSDPSWLERNGLGAVRDLVVAMAQEAGFPLPRRTASLQRQALPQSWRPYNHGPSEDVADAVIVTDVQNPMRGQRTFEVWTYGTWVASKHSLDAAKAYLERIYGPLDWKRHRAEPYEVIHYWWGRTDEFTDPVTFYTTDLPKLGAKAARAYYHGTSLDLAPGDEILPPSETGVAPRFERAHPSYSSSMVYLTTSLSSAEKWGTVYEVEPIGSVEKDPETANIPGWDVDYRAPKARVIRRVGAAKEAAGGRIYRGLRFDLPSALDEELRALLGSPTEVEQIDQHLKIGPRLLEWMQANHWARDSYGYGLGAHWTTRKEMAQTAAVSAGRTGWWAVILTATYDPADVDTTSGFAGSAFVAENEVTLHPGSRVQVLDVEVQHYGRFRSVLAQPMQATAERWTGQVPIQPGQSIYRGLNVVLGEQDWQRFLSDWDRGADLSWIAGVADAYRGDRGQGIGKHWTVDHEVARTFATGGYIGPFGTGTALFDGGHVGIVLEAEFTGGTITDEQTLQQAWRWESEQEVTIESGTPLTLRGIEVYGPARIPDRDQWVLHTGDGVFRSYRMGRQVTAATGPTLTKTPEGYEATIGRMVYRVRRAGGVWEVSRGAPGGEYPNPDTFPTLAAVREYLSEIAKEGVLVGRREAARPPEPGRVVLLDVDTLVREWHLHGIDPHKKRRLVEAIGTEGLRLAPYMSGFPSDRYGLVIKLLDGNHRVAAVGELGWHEVPVWVEDTISDAVLRERGLVNGSVRTLPMRIYDEFATPYQPLGRGASKVAGEFPYEIKRASRDTVRAYYVGDGGRVEVGYLWWKPGETKEVWASRWNEQGELESFLKTITKPAMVQSVHVEPDHRRQGVATALFRAAQQYEPDLHDHNGLTPDGERWWPTVAKVAGIEDMPLHEAVEALGERYADRMGQGTLEATEALSGALEVLDTDRSYGLQEAKRARVLLASPSRGAQGDDDAAIRRFLMVLSRTIERLAGAYPSARVPRYFTDELRRAWAAMEASMPREAVAQGTVLYRGVGLSLDPQQVERLVGYFDNFDARGAHGFLASLLRTSANTFWGTDEEVARRYAEAYAHNDIWSDMGRRYGVNLPVVLRGTVTDEGLLGLQHGERRLRDGSEIVVDAVSLLDAPDADWSRYIEVPPITMTASAAERLYHLAPASLRSEIETYGIDWTRGEKQWPDAEYPRGNYFFRRLEGLEEARYFRDLWSEHFGYDFDIWEADPEGLDVLVDPLFFGQTRYIEEPIPASRIRRVAMQASVADASKTATHETLYHGTNHELQPGEMVLSPAETGAAPSAPVSRMDRVYLTNDPAEAAKYGDHVYEVEAVGGEPEIGYWWPEHERLVPAAQVIRRVAHQRRGSKIASSGDGLVFTEKETKIVVEDEQGGFAGEIQFDPWDGFVELVWVAPVHQRQGLASRLVEMVADKFDVLPREVLPPEQPSNSPAGNAFIRSFSKVASSGDGDGWITADDGETYWGRFGAAGLLVRHTDEEGTARFFLQQRAMWTDHGGTWGIPGGALDSHETPLDGAVREFTEETGVPTHALGGVIDEWTFEPAPEWSYTTVVVEATDQFDSHYNSEQSGTGWFTVGEMQAMRLHPGLRDSMPKIKRHGMSRHPAIRPKAKVLV